MKLHTKGWAVLAAVALVGSMASTALAIEAFQERFEWGDLSKPTTIQGRVIVLDPYDEAVWINVAVFGGNAESGLWWQKIHPGKNLKFYADKAAWAELKKMARPRIRRRPDRICRHGTGAEPPCDFFRQEAPRDRWCARKDPEHHGPAA